MNFRILGHHCTADITKAGSHLKEAAVGIQDGWQVPADIGVHRRLNVNVLKAHFNAWRMDSHPANNSTLLDDYMCNIANIALCKHLACASATREPANWTHSKVEYSIPNQAVLQPYLSIRALMLFKRPSASWSSVASACLTISCLSSRVRGLSR